MEKKEPESYLNITEAAELLGFHRVTFTRTVHRPTPDILLGGKPGWKRETLEKWQEDNKELIAALRSRGRNKNG